MSLQQRVQDRLRPALAPQARVLCAVSGGPDSMALAHALRELPYEIVLGHVDHSLRKNSTRDAQFVFQLSRKWDLPCKIVRVSVLSHAKRQGKSLEEAARDLRYKALLKMAHQNKCCAILTAHTSDDQAETVLMNFLRGSGPAGLAGIPELRVLASDVRLVRPLLSVSRKEVLSYLSRQRTPFRQDPSNRSLRFTRNRIRHQVLPLLERQFPGLKQRLIQMSQIFREEAALWADAVQRESNKTVRQNNKKITVDLTQLLGYHKALGRRILRRFLTGISFQDTERVFQLAQSPNERLPVQLPGGLRAVRKGKELIIQPRGFHE